MRTITEQKSTITYSTETYSKEETMPKRHHHTESRLNNLSVNADPEHPVYREAATEIQKRLRYMTEKHSQVFVGHLEFRFPPEMEPQNDNRHISNAIRKCRMKLKREGIDAQLVWAREQRNSDQPHYHCYPICDGNKVQHVQRVAGFFNEIWSREIDASPESNYVKKESNWKYDMPNDRKSLKFQEDY